MQDLSRFYYLYLLILWHFGLTSVFGVRKEQSQQTYVVRYKNGDLTIPVTVVLDDKKQTEYVINMSPRSPEKSVTLYDFKQRTIAYKDLTNRECFLGRLTDETLKHEIDALNEIRNPIESNPKILSLDPRKPALTPTEIRNIAGQKTAVFCRKMNTWLIMLQGSHNVRKREADEDVEERTYSHHGTHTIHYSHHERETRSRYRKPRPISSHLTHKSERFSEDENQKIRSMEPNSRPDHVLPFEEKSTKQENDSIIYVPTSQRSPYETERNSSFFSKNSDGTYNSHFTVPNNSQNRNIFIPSYHNSFGEINHQSNVNKDLNANYLQNNSSEYTEYSTQRNPPHILSIFNNSSKTSFRNELDDENLINYDKTFISDENSTVETEYHPTDLSLPKEKKIKASPFDYTDNHTENPDVSIDVLEIPKASAKFETLNQFPEPHQAFVQPNEDVHAIFEGFHNLRNTYPTHDKSSLPINPYETETHLYTDHANGLKSFHPVLPPHQKSYSVENTFQERTTNLPTTKYFPTIQPYFKNHADIYVNKTKLFSHQNANGDKTENKLLVLSQPDNANLYQNSLRSFDKNQNSTHNRNIENTSFNKFLPSVSVPATTSRDGVAPNQLRFQSVLRHYKPDEIIIDIEKIPTERPPNSISRFEENVVPSNHFKNRKHFSDGVRTKEITRTRQATGLRNNRLRNTSHPRKSFSNGSRYFQHGITFHPRSNQHRFEEHKKIPLFSPPNKPPFVNHHLRPNAPSFYNEPSGILDTLPPGVSLHPRHPQAPYANMLNINTLQQLPQKHNTRPLKSHRQRHHRKKDHNMNRMNGRSSSCCSGLSRRGQPPDVSCCPQLKRGKNSKFLHYPSAVFHGNGKFQSQVPLKKEVSPTEVSTRSDPLPISDRKTASDKRNRCQKEKMCRTLYESTRQVMVCRNIDIEGC